MASATINLRKFDMSKLKQDAVVVFIGKRNTGKSFLVRDMLYYKRDFPCGIVISGTESSNGFYSHMMPGVFIHDDFKPEIVESLIKRQKTLVHKVKEQEATYGRTNLDPRAFLILDDLMFDTSWIKDMNIRRLFMNGRHHKLLYVITMQYCLGIPPTLRTNVDYVFILREPNIGNRKRLYEQYAGIFKTFEMFCQVMDQCTENHECLVVDNTSRSNNIEDMVFWYKADDHPDFKIGSAPFWEYHSQHQRSQSMDTGEMNINDVGSTSRRGPIINVKKF